MPAALPDRPDPFAPATLGPVTLRNRFVKAATFEGMAPGGLVSDGLVAFHRTMAEGGVALTTLAYCAVSEDGQGVPNEIVVREAALPGLQRLTDAVHRVGAAAAIQLGHAGPVSAGTGRQGLSPSRVFAPQALRFTKAVTTADLARITGDFAGAAQLAVRAGFDVLELHFGHGYLVSAFLSPKLNRRKDHWGGSLENRARLARDVAKVVRDAVGTRAAVTAKLNMADGVPGGLWLDESVEVARLLEADGALDALQLTGGSSFQNPMYLFRGEAPIEDMAKALPPHLSLRGSLLPALRAAVSRRAPDAAHPPRRHQPDRDSPTRARRGLCVRRHGPCAPARARPGRALAPWRG